MSGILRIRLSSSLTATSVFVVVVAALLACSQNNNKAVATIHRPQTWLGTKPPQRGWGLHKRRIIIKTTAKLPEHASLEDLLLQVRGGSSYGGGGGGYNNNYDDDQGGYYPDDNDGFDENDWRDSEQQPGDYGNDYYADEPRRKDRYDDYDDRGVSRPGSSNAVQDTISSFQAKIKNGDRRIGLPLLAAGVALTMLGVSLFFNKSLMRLGNLLLIAGVPVTIGPGRTAGYFFQPQKTRATACLFAGIFLVFVGWPIFGIALEIFGLLNLFGNMFPMIWAIVKNLPIVSSITNNNNNNSGGGGGKGRQSYPSYYDRERERDYVDDPYRDDRGDYDDYYRDDDQGGYY